MDSRIEDFLRVLRQGASVFVYSAQAKFPNAFKKIRLAVANTKESSQYKREDWNSLFISENQTSLVQSNQRACLTQTGDEWVRQWRHRGHQDVPG
jgi:hypothetical protein